MLKNTLGCQIILIAAIILPGYALPLDETRLETINISADEAFEDIQPGIMHFKGNFLMQSRQWKLESAQATVFGQPDRLDKVLLGGSPARFFITRDDGDELSTVEAEAPAMEYLRSTNVLTLTGGAMLKLDGEVIRSKMIKYDTETNRYWAGGVDGVMIEVPPDNR